MGKNSKILLIFTAVTAAVSVLFRVFQLLVAVDYSEMGFFSPDAGFLASQGLYIIFAAGAVALTAGAVLDKRKGSSSFSVMPQAFDPKQTAVMGGAFLIGACLRLYDLVFNFGGFSVDFFGEVIIFAVFTAIGFILLAHKALKPATGYLQLVISISYTVKAASLFMQDTIIVRVSDELILLLSYVASVLFFLALGRFISSNESKSSRFKLIVFAGASTILSLCASLPGHIALIIDSDYMKGHMEMHPISQLGTAIVAAAVLAVMYRKKNNIEKNGEPDEKNENSENVRVPE